MCIEVETRKEIAIQINGATYYGTSDETILAVALRNHINIPNMCYDERLEPCLTCGLCVCEVNGTFVRTCHEKVENGMVVTTHNKRIEKERKYRLSQMLDHHKGDCKAPCVVRCPANSDAQGYIKLIKQGDFKASIKLIKEKLPMAASLGRVCPHPCESVCRRGYVDEPISIQWLKRAAADKDLEEEVPYMPEIGPETGKRVAIIGAGPMGISCAYFLRQYGHGVDIYEAMPHPGGMLRYGIPQYRLPKEVIDAEVAVLERMGIAIHYDQKLGDNLQFDQVYQEYDAVVMAVGAWRSTGVGCEGENLHGVMGGIEYLEINMRGKNPNLGDRIAVIGGGNTAMDVCRTAVRLGAKEVYSICWHKIEDMAAEPIEIEEAQIEEVIFKNLYSPIKISRSRGGNLDVLLKNVELGQPDANGRRVPIDLEEPPHTIEVDMVILATGQAVAALDIEGIDKTARNGIVYDRETHMTSMEGVFAGGDCGNDKISIAVEATADARRTAISVHHYLEGKQVDFEAPIFLQDAQDFAGYGERAISKRAYMLHLDNSERKETFEEIVFGYSDRNAKQEAARCLECGCHDYNECKLIAYAQEYKVESSHELKKEEHELLLDNDKFIRRNPNKCIWCGKCIEACRDLMCIGAMGSIEEGSAGRYLQFSDDLRESGCVGCGLCVSVCPTGALEAKQTNKKAYWETNKTKTTCTYCGVGCQLNLIEKWGKIIGTEPVRGTSNEGMCCVKGKFAYNFIQHDDRLKTPMIRKDGVLVPTTWDEALDVIEEKLKSTKAEFGPDSIQGFSSAKVTNEENYLFQKFFRAGIGTNNIDHCARLCHASTVSGLYNSLGSGAMTNPMADVKNAEVIFVTGSNTTETHPVMGAYIRQAKKNGAKLIVADPKRIPLCDIADIYLQIKPGTSVALANTMLHIIFQEGLEDSAYIAEHTEGIEELRKIVEQYTPEYGAAICGLNVEDVIEAARLYAKSRHSYIAYAMGITQHTNGTNNVLSMSNLALATGNIGRPGTGINPLRGQSNVQGACDMGALPGDYPAYQKVGNQEVREKFEKLWGVPLSSRVGYAVTETCDAILEGNVKVLYVMGENPVVSDPDTTHVIKALEKSFLIVQDIFLTETAEYADVLLPATSFAEKDGTFTNTERRVQRVRKAIEPIGESRNDWEILVELMKRFNMQVDYQSPCDIFEEIRLASPTYAGMNYEKINEDGMCWPCRTEDSMGTPILHVNGPLKGKGTFFAFDWEPSPDLLDPEYPMVLMTGRVLEHFHTRTMTGRTQRIHEMHPTNYIELNREDAKEYEVESGDTIQITSKRASIEARVVVSDNVARHTAFMPFHYANGANMLTDGKALDKTAKIPGFKQVGVRLNKLV
ncbi:MAG: formate dehydrogenase subunit alpha [Eubacteriales bacterium]